MTAGGREMCPSADVLRETFHLLCRVPLIFLCWSCLSSAFSGAELGGALACVARSSVDPAGMGSGVVMGGGSERQGFLGSQHQEDGKDQTSAVEGYLQETTGPSATNSF